MIALCQLLLGNIDEDCMITGSPMCQANFLNSLQLLVYFKLLYMETINLISLFHRKKKNLISLQY